MMPKKKMTIEDYDALVKDLKKKTNDAHAITRDKYSKVADVYARWKVVDAEFETAKHNRDIAENEWDTIGWQLREAIITRANFIIKNKMYRPMDELFSIINSPTINTYTVCIVDEAGRKKGFFKTTDAQKAHLVDAYEQMLRTGYPKYLGYFDLVCTAKEDK